MGSGQFRTRLAAQALDPAHGSVSYPHIVPDGVALGPVRAVALAPLADGGGGLGASVRWRGVGFALGAGRDDPHAPD